MSPLPCPRPVFETSKELIIEILFGEGGDDSKLFVHQLYEAYTKYASSLNIKSEVLDSSFGHTVVKFTGNAVWQAFKNESGKHCVQRYPENDRGGRRQTSMISVAILPLPPEKDFKPLPNDELDITTQCGKQNAGGQHVNKSQTAVRIKHIPTGVSVFINGRSQGKNKEEALRVITAKVNEMRANQVAQQYGSSRKEQIGDGGRSGKVRTYNFIRDEITDHRLNRSVHNAKDFMKKGDFETLFKEEDEQRKGSDI